MYHIKNKRNNKIPAQYQSNSTKSHAVSDEIRLCKDKITVYPVKGCMSKKKCV